MTRRIRKRGRGAALGLALLLGTSVVVVAPTATAESQGWSSGVESWVTDLAGDERLAAQPTIDWQRGVGTARATIVVDPSRRYQTMTGFGASMTDSSAYVLSELPTKARTKIMRSLFSSTDGIGLSMLRQPMGASDFAVEKAYSYDDQPAGQIDPALSDFSVDHDREYILPRLREAYTINPELTFMATPWSAPGWMKTSDSLIAGSLLPQYEQAYAQYFVRFIEAYREAGIPTHYVSMQNEPLYEPSDYPGMEVFPPQEAEFIAAQLAPALRNAGLQTKILAYDHNWDIPDYPEAVHGAVPAATVGTAWHCYAGEAITQSVSHNDFPLAQAFETECSGGGWQGDQTQAFEQSMDSVIDVPRNWGQSVVLWNVALDENDGPHVGGCSNCRGLVTTHSDGSVTKEPDYWALGQLSRYVRPGAVRIGSSSIIGADSDGVRNVAFQNPDGSLIMVVHNSATRSRSFDVALGDRHFSTRLAGGAAATYRWRAPDRLASAGDLGFVDLDFGPGTDETPTGRVVQSVGPDVLDHLTQVRLGRRWLIYSQPYGAVVERSGSANALPRSDWRFSSRGTTDIENAPVSNLIDGDRATRWASGSGQSKGMSLTVDLRRKQTFTEISLDSGSSIGDYLRRYRVEISNNRHHWRTVARGPGHTGEMIIALPPTTARYVRLVSEADSGSWWSIHELNLRRTAEASTTEPAEPGDGLIADSTELSDGTQVIGYYNHGLSPAAVPWPVEGFEYGYRLPPTAAVTFAVVDR